MRPLALLSACLSLALPLASAQSVSAPTGLWEFGNSASIGQATVGNGMTVVGAAPAYSATLSDGTKTLSGAITTVVGSANRLIMPNPTGGNGGGSYTNEYTLLFDVFTPAAARSAWRCLLQTNTSNGNDGDYFIRNSDDKLGISATLGYSTNPIPETAWTRLVLVFDVNASLTASTVKVYINGSLFHTHNFTGGRDGTYALESTALLFADNDAENAALNIGAVGFWGKLLTAAEITTLGGAGAPIIQAPVNQAPVIAEGATTTMPTAVLNGAAVSKTLTAADAENQPLTWSITTPAASGTAGISSQTSGQCVLSYTPAPGFTGSDSFIVRADDGAANDEIRVYVVVSNPSQTTKVFYQENFNNAALVAEVTTSDQRRMPAGDNTPVWNLPENTGLGLASGANVFLNPANLRIQEFTGFNLMRTDFWRNGDDQGRSTAFPAGNNVIAVADSDEFSDGAGSGGPSTEGEFNVFLRTPVFTLPAGSDLNRMVFTFLSSFRLEENETSRVNVFLNGSTSPAVVLNVPNNGTNPAAPVTFTWKDLGYPAPGSTVQLEFAHQGADNNWWWAFDDIYVGIPNNAPVISEGGTLSYQTGLTTPVTATVNVTDADNDPITWSFGSSPLHGSVSFGTTSDSAAGFTYIPAGNFVGTDIFTIRAFDGVAYDTIQVSVTTTNQAPEISEGEVFVLNVAKDQAQAFSLHSVDPDGDALLWTVSAAPASGNANITTQSNTDAAIDYIPAPGYTGTDSFQVTVSDAAGSSTITINVVVSDPEGNPALTIVTAHGTSSPAAGVYEHPRGTSLTNSATDETGATTRHTVTGWTMTGDGPSTGTANPMSMTLTRDSTLTWLYRTEHRVELAAAGSGTINVTSGWFEAGEPLQITATPSAGYHFSGWTGDTAGCQTGGKSIVIPMDRARTTITANFISDENFTFIAMPDTQNYTSITSPTDLYTRQAQWIVDNRETMNIKFATHLGDIVNSPTSQSQWLRATDAMNVMNNRTPYGTCPGNHDIASGNTDYLRRFGPNPTHASSVGRWIDPATSQSYDWYGGSSPRGYSSYQIVNVNGRDFMFLHMDHDAPDQDLAWAASVLSAHPKVLTMVTTHNYLAETGGTGIYGSGTGQRGYTAQANVGTWGDRPDTNRPQEVFDAIVKPFNQVYMVICGHMFGTYNLQKTNNAGNIVHEVLVDYQSLPNGGNGFLRIMDFRPQENKIYNTSYSPYLGRYIDPNVNADHQGMLDLHDRNGSEFILNTDFDTRFNNTLTVVSSRGGVTPAVGTHEIEDGTPVAISADLQVSGQTRYRPTGWTLTGGQTASGSGTSGTIIQNGDATLTWNYATEHQLVTSTVGGGLVSNSGGWYAAGSSVNIQAQPDAGQSFLQWSGDISGCTITGPVIAVPMDRPRGPITAEFTSPVPSHTIEVVSAFAGATPAAATYTYDQGTTVTFTAADVPGDDTRRICTGYTVTGAVTQAGPETSVNLTLTGDMVLTWNWKTQYLVTTAVSGPGTVSPDGWYDGGSSVTVTGTPQSGSSLSAWTGDTELGTQSGNDFTIASLTRPVGPLTAVFTTGSHILTVVSPHETTAPLPGGHAYDFGSTVEFSAVSMETGGSRQRPVGWALSGASNLTGSGTTGSFIITGDTTLTWIFTPEVLLAITSGTEGAVLPMNSTGWHALGENVTLTATPAPMFAFRRWTGDVPNGSTDPSLTLTMDQPRSVTADIMPLATAGGTPHWWLDRFAHVNGGNFEAAGLGDNDGDGETAADEFVAGLSDLDAGQRFAIQQFVPTGGGSGFQITAPAREGRLYQLMQTADLATPFSPIGSPVEGVPPSVVFTPVKPVDLARNFYSVKVTLSGTSIRDGDPSAASSTPLPGSLQREMKLIPGGTFTQGDNTGPTPSRPTHPVQVTGFMMDKFEVTRADWEKVATWALAHGYDIPVTLKYNQAPYNVPMDHPAVAVSWYDSVKWCNARSEMEGRRPVYFTDTSATAVYRTGENDLVAANVNWAGDGYRLPTESEWERASRGGLEGKKFPWGDEDADLRSNSWNFQLFTGRAPDEDFPYTERVGYFDGTQPGGMPDMKNGYGLHDMSANAWEWVWDRMGDYSADKQYDPKGPDEGGVQRVQRGGSWWNYVDQATNFQRLPFPPNGSDDYGMIGFRCVRGLHPNE